MNAQEREWNFEPPVGIADREAGLEAVLKKIRYDLTSLQGKVSEALRMVAELDLPDRPPLSQTYMNGPVLAAGCPLCGVGGGLHTDDCGAVVSEVEVQPVPPSLRKDA